MINDSLKILIQNWIIKHPSVVESPIAKDTILVRDMITGNKDRRVGKYLIQISIRELHNDLIKSKNEGCLEEVWNGKKLLVSDTGLRYMIPINARDAIQNMLCPYTPLGKLY